MSFIKKNIQILVDRLDSTLSINNQEEEGEHSGEEDQLDRNFIIEQELRTESPTSMITLNNNNNNTTINGRQLFDDEYDEDSLLLANSNHNGSLNGDDDQDDVMLNNYYLNDKTIRDLKKKPYIPLKHDRKKMTRLQNIYYMFLQYMMFTWKEVSKRKISYLIGTASCFVVVWMIMVSVSALSQVPLVFIRLAELQVGEFDFKLKSGVNMAGISLNYTKINEQILNATKQDLTMSERFSYHSPRFTFSTKAFTNCNSFKQGDSFEYENFKWMYNSSSNNCGLRESQKSIQGSDYNNGQYCVPIDCKKYAERLSLYLIDTEKDREIVFEAVKKSEYALELAPYELIHDREIIFEAVKYCGYAVQYAPDELKKDREIVMEAVKQNGLALQYVCDELRNDREIVMEAIKRNAQALSFASDELRDDKTVLEILNQVGGLEHISFESMSENWLQELSIITGKNFTNQHRHETLFSERMNHEYPGLL